jgi:hypothetical protein
MTAFLSVNGPVATPGIACRHQVSTALGAKVVSRPDHDQQGFKQRRTLAIHRQLEQQQ